MATLQPVLVPCNGVLADLHVAIDPRHPDQLQLFWGTAVLHVIPRDKNSLIFRIVAALLANLKFKMSAITAGFGVSEKTLREWRAALSSGDWNQLAPIFHGPGMPKKLRPDVEAYARGRYREAVSEGVGATPYGFRKQLLQEIHNYWGIETNEETLRQIFRNEDQKRTVASNKASVMESLLSGQGETAASMNVRDSVDVEGNQPMAMPAMNLPAPMKEDRFQIHVGAGGDAAKREEPCVLAASVAASVDETANLASVFTEERVCLTVPSAAADGAETADARPVQTLSKGQGPCATVADLVAPADETHKVPSLLGPKPSHPGVASLAKTQVEIPPAEPIGRLAEPEASWTATTDAAATADAMPPIRADGTSPASGPSSAAGRSKANRSVPSCRALPLLGGDNRRGPFLSQHAGLLILAPWFEQALAELPPIVRQTAAQILCGAVNQEQSKLMDYNGLEPLLGEVVRDIDYQHGLLYQHTDWRQVLAIYRENAKLLNLSRQTVFYVDPHHEEYTGIENILVGWSGCLHRPEKGLLLDFIHTEWGCPCFLGHFDAYYDARQRFLILRRRFLELLGGQEKRFVWIQDRGYWGLDFMRQIQELGDAFIQWEKGYDKSAWDGAFEASGTCGMTRRRNHRRDKRRYRFSWREQRWTSFLHGRKFIVRARNPEGRVIEVAIVTSDRTLPAQRIIRLMFNRWLQEGDFGYLGRHFGINELTGRMFEPYARLQDELEDRQVASRAYKTALADKQRLSAELGSRLVQLQEMTPVSVDRLSAERQRIQRQAQALSEKLEEAAREDGSPTLLDRIGREIGRLQGRWARHKEQRHAEDRRQAQCQEVEGLTRQLNQAQAKLQEIGKTESRILALIEEQRVRPDMRKKALVDAIRVTSRNLFHCPFNVFRPIYNNHRDDHVVLRALTRSSGVIIPYPDRVDIYLTPQLERQPAEWARIRQFLRICECRIAARFRLRVRILVQKSDAEIFHAISRARSSPCSDAA